MPPLAVIAIGGNSIIKDSAHQSLPDQKSAVRETAGHIAEMVAQGWNVVITHGNGPQVGFILLRSELARHALHHTLPLDVAGADSQGGIGYMIQQALRNEFRRRGLPKQTVTLVTQTLIDPADPAMQHPSKPIGPFYKAEEVEQTLVAAGAGSSPRPIHARSSRVLSSRQWSVLASSLSVLAEVAFQ